MYRIMCGLSLAAVLPLTMSLNELCTNAVKYGALSVPKGRVTIAMSVDEKAERFRPELIKKLGLVINPQ